jgi:peptidoglycan/xylan/chitin deacetylase (PgdA/CDA1 family)
LSERDLIGYGATPPRICWPNDARIAISLVVNDEEVSENLLQDGIGKREVAGESLSPVPLDRRDLANESFFEYGSRAVVWRLFRIFKKHQVRCTFFACAVALERNPAVGPAITAEGHDILAHGNRCPRLQRTA